MDGNDLLLENGNLVIDGPAGARAIFRIPDDANFLASQAAILLGDGGIEPGSVLFYTDKLDNDAHFSFSNAVVNRVAFWDLGDAGFLYCGKERPELYFDPGIRAGISSVADLSDPLEFERGLARLRADLASGRFREVAAAHPTPDGDRLRASERVIEPRGEASLRPSRERRAETAHLPLEPEQAAAPRRAERAGSHVARVNGQRLELGDGRLEIRQHAFLAEGRGEG